MGVLVYKCTCLSRVLVFRKKSIQRSNLKVSCHLLMSCKVNDVTKRAPREYNGLATLMAQGSRQDLLKMQGTHYEFTTMVIALFLWPRSFRNFLEGASFERTLSALWIDI